MQVLLNTDNNINGGESLAQQVTELVEQTLGRFGNRITRVEVYITDENSTEKDSDNDKRCVMEARVAGMDPVAVRVSAGTIMEAVDAAAETLEQTLDRHLGRLEDPKGRISFGGEQ